ncbi:hypothetical protein ScPMuIL_017050 [Solemya velum]
MGNKSSKNNNVTILKETKGFQVRLPKIGTHRRSSKARDKEPVPATGVQGSAPHTEIQGACGFSGQADGLGTGIEGIGDDLSDFSNPEGSQTDVSGAEDDKFNSQGATVGESTDEIDEDDDQEDEEGAQRRCKRSSLILAAVDFGTTFSGYVYSMLNDYDIDPLRIMTPQNWPSRHGSATVKTPSAILFRPDKTFHSFGYQAVTDYSDMFLETNPSHDKDPSNWYFFQNYKMLLYDEKMITRDTELKEEGGKKMSAMYVFSQSLKYLRESLLDYLQKSTVDLEEKDIFWVLTVPAIWSDRAKQFMREAAVKAGISGDSLALALEPEAAAVYCKHLSLQRVSDGRGARIEPLAPGTQFMVIDMGGGTTDITLYEIVEGGALKEIHPADGEGCGGNVVNSCYFKFVENLVGEETFRKFKKEFHGDFLDMQQEFEQNKRRNYGQYFKFTVPTELENFCRSKHDKSIGDILTEAFQDRSITAKRDKMHITHEKFQKFFQFAIKRIIKHVDILLESLPPAQNPVTLLLVGGFADCSLVRDAFVEQFPNNNIVTPDEAVNAVLKGAVLFGRDPSVIASRAIKHTYGIEVWPPFNPQTHPENRRKEVGGKWVCEGVFRIHVQVGSIVTVGEPMDEIKYNALDKNQDHMSLPIFVSTELSPTYVTDDSCTYLGTLDIDMKDTTMGTKRAVYVRMIFEGTEFAVEARDETTGDVAFTKVDCLV